MPALFNGDEDGEIIKIRKVGIICGGNKEIEDDGGDVSISFPQTPKCESELLIVLDVTIAILNPEIGVLKEFGTYDDGWEAFGLPSGRRPERLVSTLLDVILKTTDVPIPFSVDPVHKRTGRVPPSDSSAHQTLCFNSGSRCLNLRNR